MRRGLIPETIRAAKRADYTQCPEVQEFIMDLADGRAQHTHPISFLRELSNREALEEWANRSREYQTYPAEEDEPQRPSRSILRALRAAIP